MISHFQKGNLIKTTLTAQYKNYHFLNSDHFFYDHEYSSASTPRKK